LPEGQLPADVRLGELKTLNSYFPFEVPDSAEAWQLRAAQLRRQMKVALGLWPEPTRTPARAVVHGAVERDDFIVERVYFESFPGHFVTGSLYRPRNARGKLPAVLCPHGHWPNGRFMDRDAGTVQREILAQAEKFESAARNPIQARCVQLARMGCIVLQYDMLGYADSQQIAHRPGVRAAMNTPENWGFFSPQAELRMQTMMGLQTYNSVRALDWLLSRDDVDPQRIGVTGASGGGTQTFFLCAVDERPAVAFPAVMVSTAMQGGCTCENASYLRVGTGNVEIAALFAPKPLGVSSANDWTKEMSTKGMPELRRLYALLGHPHNVMLHERLEFGHNYNHPMRLAMYRWFNEHLKLGVAESQVDERDFEFLTQADLTVWDAQHPRPPAGDEYERSLLRTMTADQQEQLSALWPRDAKSAAEFRRVVGGAWEVLIGRRLPQHDHVEWKNTHKVDRGHYWEFAGLVRNTAAGEELPTVFLHPKSWNKQVVIWAFVEGKSGLFSAAGTPRPEVQRLIDAGYCVASADLLYQGEFRPDGKPLESTRLVGSGRDTWQYYAGYTFGYNQPLFAQRTSDLLTLVAYIRSDDRGAEKVHLVAEADAALWAAAARAIAGPAVDAAVLQPSGFRFAELDRIDHPHFLPGAVKYGDVPALLALGAPHRVWLVGPEAEGLKAVQQAYAAAGAASQFRMAADVSLAEALRQMFP
jgi:dienelactone hydrolase